MEATVKTDIWQQFGAAIDFLSANIEACPDELWTASMWQTPDTYEEFSHFWYVAYHTLFWLDLYLTGTEEGFVPPSPFTLIEMDANAAPPATYTKSEIQTYLSYCRQRCQQTISALTDEKMEQRCSFSWGECSYLELLLYNMRHVHGHASQLNMLLGQHGVPVTSWIAQARDANA